MPNRLSRRRRIDRSGRVAGWRRSLTGGLASLVGMGGAALAQAPVEDDPATFDEDRAYIVDETIFVPFRPTEADLQPLRTALDEGLLQPGTWLFIVENEAGRLALVMDQMAYHHVAQGELKGEPWMVSF